MKSLLKDFFRYCFEVLNEYPIVSLVFILTLCSYLIIVALPSAYKGDREHLYPYYSKLGLVLALIFTLISFFLLLL